MLFEQQETFLNCANATKKKTVFGTEKVLFEAYVSGEEANSVRQCQLRCFQPISYHKVLLPVQTKNRTVLDKEFSHKRGQGNE